MFLLTSLFSCFCLHPAILSTVTIKLLRRPTVKTLARWEYWREQSPSVHKIFLLLLVIKRPREISKGLFLSGRKDLNLRPLAPHASTLAGLRHAPIGSYYTLCRVFSKSENVFPGCRFQDPKSQRISPPLFCPPKTQG